MNNYKSTRIANNIMLIEDVFAFQSQILNAANQAIIATDLSGIITFWSRGAEQLYGWTSEEAIGRYAPSLTSAESALEQGEEIMSRLMKGESFSGEYSVKRKDGTEFPIQIVNSPIYDNHKNLIGIVGFSVDIAERKEAEKVLQEKESLQKIVTAQENERRRIARNIHDQLGQQITALRLKLNQLEKSGGAAGVEHLRHIREAEKIVEQIDHDVDFIAWDLRPISLDDLGLRLTFFNYIKDWARYTGIKAEFHTHGIGKDHLPFEVETSLYRIVQEALNNIAKHAKARNVSVIVEKRKGTLALIIEDDGIGFNVEDKRAQSRGMGLIGMRERAKLIGGELEIESSPKTGTTIFVHLSAKFTNGNKS